MVQIIRLFMVIIFLTYFVGVYWVLIVKIMYKGSFHQNENIDDTDYFQIDYSIHYA